MVILSSCCSCVQTIAPAPVVSQEASWDGSEKNSGFLGWTTNSGVVYGMLTPHAKDRYNGLIDIYGNKFIPPIKKNYGIIDNFTNSWITLEGLQDFAKMNRWKKGSATP